MPVDITKIMTNEIFTMNDKETQSENEYNELQNQANQAASLLYKATCFTYNSLVFTLKSKS